MSKHYRSQEKGRVKLDKGGAPNSKANVANAKGSGSQKGNQLPAGKGNKLASEHGKQSKDAGQYGPVKNGLREMFGKGDGSR